MRMRVGGMLRMIGEGEGQWGARSRWGCEGSGLCRCPSSRSHALRHPSRYLPADILPVVVVPLNKAKISVSSEPSHRPHITARQLQRLGNATVPQSVWASHDPRTVTKFPDDPTDTPTRQSPPLATAVEVCE
jgi:hypothetical protein